MHLPAIFSASAVTNLLSFSSGPALPCCSSLLEALQQVSVQPGIIFIAIPGKMPWCTDRSWWAGLAWFANCIHPLLWEGKYLPREAALKYTVASLPQPWLQKLTSLSLESSLPMLMHKAAENQGPFFSGSMEREEESSSTAPGHHLTQPWAFCYPWNSVIQLVTKNNCILLLSHGKEGWCCLLQLYL